MGTLGENTCCGIPWRRVFRAVWILLSIATLSALPAIVLEFRKHSYSVHYQAWFVAGIFVILAVSASIYEVAMHLEYYSNPRLQIRVVRILCMVPIYALDAWLSLRFKDAAFYLDPVRECYEAFVIYNFYMYLTAYLDEQYGDIQLYYATKPQVAHFWPVSRWLAPWAPGAEFFWETKRGILNYVIVRPLATAASVAANIAGVYGDGEFRPDRVYPYVALVNTLSQSWALYCLVLMYHACHAELAPIRPLSKFIVIKAVVFFSFWQSVLINMAARLGLIRPAEYSTYDTDDVAAGLQNFLICLEMFAAAVAHAHAFPPRDYMDPARPPLGFLNNVRVMFDVRDVMHDVHGVVTEQVMQSAESVTDLGRRTWTSARSKTARMVPKPPHALRALFGRQPRREDGGPGSSSRGADSDPEPDGSGAALLPAGQQGGSPSPGKPPRSPATELEGP